MDKLYIDMDIVAYRCAASCEPTKQKPYREPPETAIYRADDLMYRILSDMESDDYMGWIGSEENFRKVLYPKYKANRGPPPQYLQLVREHLVTEWKAKVATGYETDDAIGIAYNGTGIICSIDKDLRQIPGRHYNFVKLEREDISDLQAAQSFWASMLIGDRTDNIDGIPGIGKVKAPRVLQDLSPAEMEERVRELYLSFDMDFTLNYNLLHILRSEEELFEIENTVGKCTNKQKQLMSI